MKVLVAKEHLKKKINFIVLETIYSTFFWPFDAKTAWRVIDIRSEEARLDHRGQMSTLPMDSECSQSRPLVEDTDTENFYPTRTTTK